MAQAAKKHVYPYGNSYEYTYVKSERLPIMTASRFAFVHYSSMVIARLRFSSTLFLGIASSMVMLPV